MTAERPKQPNRPCQDRTPLNIIQRPLRLSPMRNIKDEGTEEGQRRPECSCRKPISLHHRDGRVTCVRCRGLVEEVEE